MKILIMHEIVVPHDAVGTDIEVMAGILSEAHDCRVYARDGRISGLHYVPEEEIEDLIADPELVIIYHHSSWWERGGALLKMASGRIIIRYHNVTPAAFFEGYGYILNDICHKGRQQTEALMLAHPDAYWMADSLYNRRDLWRVPDERVWIVPPFNRIQEWGVGAGDPAVAEEIHASEDLNLLFVGRVVPNKGHLFLLEVLRYYCYHYDRHIRLRVIGKMNPVLKDYNDKVNEMIRISRLEDRIEFIGEVTDETLISYYKESDLMVCASLHEGFCVPVAEAQYFGLPIAALRYAAVPETIGPDQLLLGPEPADFAAALHTLKNHPEYRELLAQKGRENYDRRFSLEKIREAFLGSMEEILADHRPGGLRQRTGRVAFVSPWFAERIPGGAEMELRGAVRHLKKSGMDVEILTSCVREFGADWNIDYYPQGTEYIWQVPVTRFPVRQRNAAAFDEVNAKLMAGETLSDKEENTYCREMVNSPDLYVYIREHYDEYDHFVFIPYMFGTTYYGMQECLPKAILIPCLHDESYARLRLFKTLYPKIRGMIYHAWPEHDLAGGLYDLAGVRQTVMGEGVDTDFTYDADRFRDRYGITDPFILYAGRKDAGKGVDELMTYFGAYKESHPDSPLKFVLIGGGSLEIPESLAGEVMDLGFVDLQDKYDGQAAALCLCQLSRNESFSLVIMESWLCERPVIVHEGCPVTRDFAERFEAGRAVGDSTSFAESIDFYLQHPEEAREMGRRGREKVLASFSREVIAEKFRAFFRECQAEEH